MSRKLSLSEIVDQSFGRVVSPTETGSADEGGVEKVASGDVVPEALACAQRLRYLADGGLDKYASEILAGTNYGMAGQRQPPAPQEMENRVPVAPAGAEEAAEIQPDTIAAQYDSALRQNFRSVPFSDSTIEGLSVMGGRHSQINAGEVPIHTPETLSAIKAELARRGA